MRRDLRKAEEEEKWREKANNREQWGKTNESSRTAEWLLTSVTPTKEEQHKHNDV